MKQIDTDTQKIHNLLTRGVEDVFVREDLEKKLASGQELRIKFGIDPTGPKIHLGRAIPLRKLRAFQKLGHQIVLIIGDFTAQVGDPSDKLDKRPMLTRQIIEENMADYKSQIGKILDIDKVEFVYNGDWLRGLGFQEISELAESFSVQQMLARRNFKDRIDVGQEISLREFLYPLMQGYDSVAVNSDVEIGGFDQLFNLKAGRAIQKHYSKPEQNVLTIQMLEGTDGRKMSTSWGNIITIVDTPFDMYGKVMSIKDELIIKYYTLCTDIDLEEISSIEKNIKSGVNPRDIKMALARELVTMYHGEKEAKLAEDQFVETFQKGGVPSDAIEIRFDGSVPLVELLLTAKVIESKAEWRRLVEEGAVKHESGEKIDEVLFAPTESEVIRVGKRRFAKIKVLT